MITTLQCHNLYVRSAHSAASVLVTSYCHNVASISPLLKSNYIMMILYPGYVKLMDEKVIVKN